MDKLSSQDFRIHLPANAGATGREGPTQADINSNLCGNKFGWSGNYKHPGNSRGPFLLMEITRLKHMVLRVEAFMVAWELKLKEFSLSILEQP